MRQEVGKWGSGVGVSLQSGVIAMSNRNDQHTSNRATRPRVRPVRRPTRAERGTVLLMVVGVLALLAIIAVVYATLGRSDRAATAALVRQQRLDDQAEDIANYLADVIGRGLFSTYVERDEAGYSFLRRSGSDIPWTDEHAVSVDVLSAPGVLANAGLPGLPANGPAGSARINELFSPTGASSVAIANANVADTREHGASFLASLSPVWLGHIQGNNPNPADEPLRLRRDWLHISNFAPSGNFVNLVNLRNNFRAESGFGYDANNLPRLSSQLTLFNPANGLNFASANLERIAYTSTGQSRLPHPAIPADWTNNQVWSFRPMVDTQNAPQDHEYLFNQWADTDGDGFADARWFELVDISRAWTGNGQPKSVIPANGRMRLFVAARCIDASGLINLTTATDFARHPGQVRSFIPANSAPLTEQFARDHNYLPGASPADIDLRRVLSMADWSYEFGQDYGGGMSGFTRPRYNADTSNIDVRDYTGMTELPAAQLGAAGYLFLQRSLARDAIMLSPDSTLFGRALITPFDGTAQASLYGRVAREDEVVLPAGSPLLVPSRLMADFGDSSITPLSPDLRYLSYLHYGYRPLGSAALANTRLFFGGLGLADELELRTRQGVNDPDNTSRLEAALGARSPAAGNYRSPFRDDRPLGIEMAGRTMRVDQLFAAGNPNDTTAFARQVIATLFGDVRSRVTTISGARPIIDGPEDLTLQQDLTPDLMTLRLGAGTTPQQRRSKDLAIENVLDFYFDCLLPFRSVNGRDYSSLWKDPNSFPAAKGLAYGERAEIAFRCSLHLAVNLIDALDEDGTRQFNTGTARDDMQPTAISVEIATGSHGAISGNTTQGGPNRDYFPWISTSRTQTQTGDHPFQPSVPEVRANTVTDVAGSRVVNVFGVEPQPFIIEYGAFFIYTDAPGSLGGATDEDPPQVTTLPDGSTMVVFDEVSIGTRPGMDRADFVGEVFFIQVTNPFDDEVTLFDPSQPEKSRPTYYAKFANRCFIFGEQDDDTYDIVQTAVRLAPGETRTFYALNPGTRKQLEERIRRIHNARPPAAPDHAAIMTDGFMSGMNGWFETQFGANAIQIPMVYPETFEPIGKVVGGGSASTTYLGEYIDLFGEDPAIPRESSGVHDAPLVANPAQRKSAELWRVMRGGTGSPRSTFPTGDITPGGDNDPENDLLADRLRDPGTSSFAGGAVYGLRDRGDFDIDSSQAGDENGTVIQSSPDQDSDVRDNTGFTAILWASIRRPTDALGNPNSGYIVTDPSLGTNRPVRGVLPPWCIEAKCDQAYDVSNGTVNTGGGRWSLNKEFPLTLQDYDAEGDFPPYSGTSDLDPVTMPASSDRFRTIAQMVASRTVIIPEIKQSAYLKDGNPILPSSSKRYDGTRKRYIDVAPEFHFVGQDEKAGSLTIPINATTNAALPRTSRNGMLFSRIGDMLLPLAVGPWSDPIGASNPPVPNTWTIVPTNTDPNSWVGGNPDFIQHEYGWTTLGESLALATGYYSPTSGPGSTVGNVPKNLYYNFGIDDPATPDFPAKTERGCLRIDKFTPYRVDGGAIIEPIGLGIPFALNVISLGRVEYGVGTTLRGNNITGLTRGAAFGGLEKAVPGVINLNTTTVEIARSLPLISPIPELAAFNPSFAPSWATQKMDLIYEPNSTTITVPSGRLFDQTARPDDVFDLATTLIAYRDKMTLDTRPKAANTPTARVAVSFADSTERSGRSMAAGLIPANTFPPRLREARGFKSIGEVLAANLKNPDGSNIADQRNQSMTRLGEPLLDGSTLPANAPPLIEQPGLVASRYYNRQANGSLTPPVGTIQPLLHSDLHDSYSGKIAIANALAGTASVRSDVFICWFVVHGYLPEDTQVEDDVPMVPTVAKRFVMVVDRSNVTSSDQQPRVLMFKEVPMSGN